MNLHKILKILAAILGLLGIIFLVMIISKGDDAIDGGDDAVVDFMAYTAYTIFIAVLVFVVGFVLKNLFTDTHSLKGTLIGVGAFVVVLAISYGISGGDEMTYLSNKEAVTAGTSQIVGAGLVAFYILILVAAAAMAAAGVKKIIQ